MIRAKVFLGILVFFSLGSSIFLGAEGSGYENFWTPLYHKAVLPENIEIGPLQDLATPEGEQFYVLTEQFFSHLEEGSLGKELFLPGQQFILLNGYVAIQGKTLPLQDIQIGRVMHSERRAIVPFYIALPNAAFATGELFFEKDQGQWYVSGSTSLVGLLPKPEGDTTP